MIDTSRAKFYFCAGIRSSIEGGGAGEEEGHKTVDTRRRPGKHLRMSFRGTTLDVIKHLQSIEKPNPDLTKSILRVI